LLAKQFKTKLVLNCLKKVEDRALIDIGVARDNKRRSDGLSFCLKYYELEKAGRLKILFYSVGVFGESPEPLTVKNWHRVAIKIYGRVSLSLITGKTTDSFP